MDEDLLLLTNTVMQQQLASNESSDMYGPDRVLAIVPREGFETSYALQYPARFARAAALDADWNVLGSSGIVDVGEERVFGDVRPVTAVKQEGSVVVSDDGYSVSLSTSEQQQQHHNFPGESGVFFGIPLGWHTMLGCALLVGLWVAAWVV